MLVAGVAVAMLGAARTGRARALPADSDGDGIADAGDACPDAAGLEPDGCPPTDRDGDGVLDRTDPCPDQAGPEGNRGCPDGDGDGDGAVDRRDRCPDQRGHADAGGCQLPDRDGDAIADAADACPDGAEVWNGRRDRDGCPDAGRAVLEVQPGRIELAPGRWFRGSGRLQSAGRDAVACAADALMAARAWRVRIEVTADGPAQARAQAEQLGRALAAARPGLHVELAPGLAGSPRVRLVFE
ncbi:MAG TPA: thrombospondin type 3 repeat-containing protein [Haliangium sp.]|nr:thrombospondin type 3 repeat-containing protein [Haliangium sp.]